MARKSRKNAPTTVSAPVPVSLRAAMYIRLSVEDYNNRGNSLENQRLVISDYLLDKPDIQVVETYIDNGQSGRDYHRPGFQKMLDAIENGSINCVIVKDLSRLGRNFIDTSYYIERYFFAHHVRFIAVTDQYDTASSDSQRGNIMLPLKNMINEAYALDISRKVRAVNRQAMLDGKLVNGQAPYGYLKDPEDCHHLILDQNTAPVVRQVFLWGKAGISLNEIVNRLNDSDFPPPALYKLRTGRIKSGNIVGQKWQHQAIRLMLMNPIYTGDMVQGKTKKIDHKAFHNDPDSFIVIRGTHEPIISYEIFDEVQRIRREKWQETQQKPRIPYTPNLFVGKVFCADCGRSLCRQRHKGKSQPDSYHFYCVNLSCPPNQMKRKKLISEEQLIRITLETLEAELVVSEGKTLTTARLESLHAGKRRDLLIQRTEKSAALEKSRSMLRRLYEDLAEGLLDANDYKSLKDEFEQRSAELTSEISVLNHQLSDLEKEVHQFRDVEQDAQRLVKERCLTADTLDKLIRRIEVNHHSEVRILLTFRDSFVQGRAAKDE